MTEKFRIFQPEGWDKRVFLTLGLLMLVFDLVNRSCRARTQIKIG
jgi:hypothetical protein